MVRFLVWVVRAVLSVVFLTAVGIVTALSLLAVPDVQRLLMVPPETPNLITLLYGETPQEDSRIIPLEQMGRMKGPNRFKRLSWEGVEHSTRPDDPRSDPTHGTTQVEFFHTDSEMRLSSALRQARLPNKVLKLGIWCPPTAHGKGKKPHPAPSSTPDSKSGHCVCYIEVYAGDPVSRAAVEETADRALTIAFDSEPMIDEIDLVAVPWRTIRGHKPPTYFSVTAQRDAYFAVAGARSHAENLRNCGAVFADPRVMSDFPLRPGQ